jgi:predicted nucleotidyltransferase
MNISKIIAVISKIQGIKAIVLGGSQSRHEADKHSDYDIGLYYESGTLDITALGGSLKELDDEHREGLLNSPGQWGPWINGGGWLAVDGVPVDILLRDINKVKNVIQDCIDGSITIDYQSGHPFGFLNTIYAAETHYCKPLWQDSSEPIDNLKSLLYSKEEYPPLMRVSMIKKFLWEAEFSLACGRKAAFKGDVNYIMGSVFRAVCSWVQVLYALNNRYLMNEKGALKWVSSLKHKPNGMEERVKLSYKLFAEGDAKEGYQILDGLLSEIEDLARKI